MGVVAIAELKNLISGNDFCGKRQSQATNLQLQTYTNIMSTKLSCFLCLFLLTVACFGQIRPDQTDENLNRSDPRPITGKILSIAPVIGGPVSSDYNRGVDLEKENDFIGAISAYTSAIEKDGKYINAYFNRGVAHYRIDSLQKAILDFTEVIQLTPKDNVAYFNRGYCYFVINDTTNACTDWNTSRMLGNVEAEEYYLKRCNR